MRECARPADTAAMQRLASRLWPAGLHPGGLGWSQATDQLATDIVVVDDVQRAEVAAWAGVSQPGLLAMQVAPELGGVTDELIGWMLETAEGPDLLIEVYDEITRTALSRHGFLPADPPFGFYRMGYPGLRSSVEDVSGALPHGYRISDARSVEADERVEVHRSAWRPADLPFAVGQGPIFDPDATSSFTSEAYRRVQSTCLYDPTLDLVVVAPDGSLAGCCLGWFDPDTGWAEIEPVGVVASHRRRGLAGALCAAVAAEVAELGGRNVFINTGDSDLYPAPYATYRKAGFKPFGRGAAMSLRRDG